MRRRPWWVGVGGVAGGGHPSCPAELLQEGRPALLRSSLLAFASPKQSLTHPAPPRRHSPAPRCPQINWGVDLTEGRAADPWKNALLSEEAKELMYEMHAKQG